VKKKQALDESDGPIIDHRLKKDEEEIDKYFGIEYNSSIEGGEEEKIIGES
jgi:hypothetical protein